MALLARRARNALAAEALRGLASAETTPDEAGPVGECEALVVAELGGLGSKLMLSKLSGLKASNAPVAAFALALALVLGLALPLLLLELAELAEFTWRGLLRGVLSSKSFWCELE